MPKINPTLCPIHVGRPRGGEALARGIFGEHNAWGRMPYTIYPKNFSDAAPMVEHDLYGNSDIGLAHANVLSHSSARYCPSRAV